MKRIPSWATGRAARATAVVLVLYALLGFLLLPFLVKRLAPGLAWDFLRRPVTVGEVRFNPFRFTLEVRDLALNETDGTPLLGIRRLLLNLEPALSACKLAVAAAEVRLEGVRVHLVLDAQGRFNAAKLVEGLGGPEPARQEEAGALASPGAALPRLFLERAVLADGELRFTDLSGPEPITESLDLLRLEVRGISTLPDHRGTQQIEAAFPRGGAISWSGDLSLSPAASTGEVEIRGVDLAACSRFLKRRTGLGKPAGRVDLSARYTLRLSGGAAELSVTEAAVRLTEFTLPGAGEGEPLLELGEAALHRASFDLAGRTLRVPSFTVRKGTVRLTVDEAGCANWRPRRAGASSPATPVPEAAGPEDAGAAAATGSPQETRHAAGPWRVAVERFELSEIGLRYDDASRMPPLAASAGALGLSLGLHAEAGAGAPRARISGLSVRVDRFELTRPDGPDPLVGWDSLVLRDGSLDLEKREAAVRSVAVQGGGAAVVREADGTLRPFGALRPRPSPGAAPEAGADAAEPAGTPAGRPWRFSLEEFALQDFGIALADRGVPPGPAWHLDGIRATARHLANGGDTPAAFEVKLAVREGGGVEFAGEASPTGEAVRARVKLDRVDLKPLQPVLDRFAALSIESGSVSGDLDVDFRRAEPQPLVRVEGAAALEGLSLLDRRDGKPLAGCKRLAGSGIRFGPGPDHGLSVREVRIVEPYAALAVLPDRGTNLGAILKRRDAAAPGPGMSGPAGGTGKGPPFPLTVGRVRVRGGLIDFSDASLILPFAVRIRDFGGTVTGISSAPASRASLRFQGQVEPFGQASVTGSVRPGQPKGHSEIRAAFRNIAMASLSPYCATFAGRKIESGKLDLDLDYRIEESRLTSRNDIVLEQFALGERVRSPSAVDMPLDLAVALLTDGQGRIRASVPIEGDVDSPTFDHRKLVKNALRTLVKRTATAPFRALASAVGTSKKGLNVVRFEPGGDSVPPPEREKLKTLAEALTGRPGVRLIVHGRFHPALDGEALRSLRVRCELAQEMGEVPEPGEEPDPLHVDDAEAQRALEKAAARQAGPADAAEREYLQETGKKPQRVGALAGLVGRASETPEFYKILFRKLVEAAPLPPAELDALAAWRAIAVKTELVDRLGFDPDRLEVGETETTEKSVDGYVSIDLDLAAEAG